jgi:hypothetical protein
MGIHPYDLLTAEVAIPFLISLYLIPLETNPLRGAFLYFTVTTCQ